MGAGTVTVKVGRKLMTREGQPLQYPTVQIGDQIAAAAKALTAAEPDVSEAIAELRGAAAGVVELDVRTAVVLLLDRFPPDKLGNTPLREVWALATRIKDAQADTIEVASGEFGLIERALKANGNGFFLIVLGQLDAILHEDLPAVASETTAEGGPDE